MSRRDYLNDPKAPAANSIAVAASAFVQDADGRILMIRRADNDKYSIPGGQLEPGETLTECAIREVEEETGVNIEVIGLVGLYSNPDHVIAYDNGEIRQEFSICFRGRAVGGKLRVSDESREALWVAPQVIDALDIHPSTRLRIDHGLASLGAPFYT